MGSELIDLTPDDYINESETFNFRAALMEEESSTDLAASAITALTMTGAAADKSIINSRDGQDINGTNGGTIKTVSAFEFSSGSELPKIGDQLAGATSSATGTVELVNVDNGAWVDGDAEGYVYLSSVSGTFQSAENLNITGGTANVMTTDNAGNDGAVVLFKASTSDTAFQDSSSIDDEEYHYFFMSWTYTDGDSDTRTGSQEFRYTVRRKPTT